MCHNTRVESLPAPGIFEIKRAGPIKYRYYQPTAVGESKQLAIITDIYGCNDFYQSFATYFAGLGWTVYLVDLFSDLGELKEVTREAAFERRHELKDKETVTHLKHFCEEQKLNAVIGFCLGGNYVFELARQNAPVKLVAYYPFPAGLPNQDALDPAFDYLQQLATPVTVLVGDSDDSAGRENIAKLAQIATANAALDVRVYAESGHGFLAQLDSDNERLQRNAQDALAVGVQAVSA